MMRADGQLVGTTPKRGRKKEPTAGCGGEMGGVSE